MIKPCLIYSLPSIHRRTQFLGNLRDHQQFSQRVLQVLDRLDRVFMHSSKKIFSHASLSAKLVEKFFLWLASGQIVPHFGHLILGIIPFGAFCTCSFWNNLFKGVWIVEIVDIMLVDLVNVCEWELSSTNGSAARKILSGVLWMKGKNWKNSKKLPSLKAPDDCSDEDNLLVDFFLLLIFDG